KIIRAGIEDLDSTDWQQQMLGHPSENFRASLTFANIEKCIGLPVPQRKPDVTLAGIDCGRSYDWLAVVSYYLPKNTNGKSIPDLMESSIREVKYLGHVNRSEIPIFFDCDKTNEALNFAGGFIDNEPGREAAMKLCRQIKGLKMADQKNILDSISEGSVLDGGIEYPCYFIRSSKFLDMVLYGFLLEIDGMPLYRLPEGMALWKANNSPQSPFRHLTSMEKRNGEWQRHNHSDDLFHALHFAEAAYEHWLTTARNNSGQILRTILNSNFY
ncbi:MAG: hypothetical protein F6K35_25780, partial [Okeania sp. SIO2H7]|nr:hypothetical protein [Okeania sp. SIO2H7]